MANKQLIGPFRQIVSLADLPLKGALEDNQLQCAMQAGVLIEEGKILAIDSMSSLIANKDIDTKLVEIIGEQILLPAFVDAHTHLCFGGNRAKDYAMRNAGKTYLEIAKAGGGIWDTVQKTRLFSEKELETGILQRANDLLQQGITTIEIKSGYGLNLESELAMLRAIQNASDSMAQDVIATCLAAHIKPKDFEGDHTAYLAYVLQEILPKVKEEQLASRVDAFIEEEAFSEAITLPYLQAAKEMGFDICVHADQFSTGGSKVAIAAGAISADHLEASTKKEIEMLANSDTIAMALPGASMGLGCAFTPARALLDAGAAVAIASDYNPGSAPMGHLLTQAAILGTFQKLSNAEVLAGITYRAAAALNLADRGRLAIGEIADMVSFPTDNYQNIFYRQGQIAPNMVWKNGQLFQF
ncbi:MAG: imidazolonepropionase [Flavobacteriaceae bacterium]|nr:imidazolonepropionase [Flavobacteriaceae bacterium]